MKDRITVGLFLAMIIALWIAGFSQMKRINALENKLLLSDEPYKDSSGDVIVSTVSEDFKFPNPGEYYYTECNEENDCFNEWLAFDDFIIGPDGYVLVMYKDCVKHCSINGCFGGCHNNEKWIKKERLIIYSEFDVYEPKRKEIENRFKDKETGIDQND